MKKIVEVNKEINIEELINSGDLIVIFVTTDNCSVCHDDLPKVVSIVNKFDITLYHINASCESYLRGYFNLFTSPVVMIYFKAREYHRQARFIDFKELEYRINEIKENMHIE